jgi:hemerythrin superfamily protein
MELPMDRNDTDDTAAEHSSGAIHVLTDDHNRVRGLFKYFSQLKGAGPTDERIAVVEDICKELTIHAAIEEELFYPAARSAIDDDELIDEAEVEHATARYLMQQLLPVDKGDARFNAKVTVLREYIKHHMNEEETEIFPKIKQAKLDLSALGEQLMHRKEELRDQLKSPEQVIGFEPVKYFVGRSQPGGESGTPRATR